MKPDYKLVAKAKYIHANADLASEIWHEVYKRYYPAKQLDTLVETLQSSGSLICLGCWAGTRLWSSPGRTSKHWEWTRSWSARSCRSRKPKSRVSGKNCGTGWTAEIFREFFLHQGLILQKIGL